MPNPMILDPSLEGEKKIQNNEVASEIFTMTQSEIR
jgi:hypothetical protein